MENWFVIPAFCQNQIPPLSLSLIYSCRNYGILSKSMENYPVCILYLDSLTSIGLHCFAFAYNLIHSPSFLFCSLSDLCIDFLPDGDPQYPFILSPGYNASALAHSKLCV